jgi:hypothetical protein
MSDQKHCSNCHGVTNTTNDSSTNNQNLNLHSYPSLELVNQNDNSIRVNPNCYPNINNQYQGNPQGQQYVYQGFPINQPPMVLNQTVLVTQNIGDNICGEKIPLMEATTAIVLLVVNLLFIPGLGTMLVGCTVHSANKCKWFWIGLAQLLTSIVCVGWIWSIVTSVQIVQYINAVKYNVNFQRNIQNVQNIPNIPVGTVVS